MTGPIYTPSMLASALSLYDRRVGWTRCRRRDDGLAYVSFPSSRRPKPGKQRRTYCTTETACNCPGYDYHNGICSHVLAVKMDAAQARNRVNRKSRIPGKPVTPALVDAF